MALYSAILPSIVEVSKKWDTALVPFAEKLLPFVTVSSLSAISVAFLTGVINYFPR